MYNDTLSQMSTTFEGVYFFCMKRFCKTLFILLSCSFFLFSFCFVSLADVNDLLIGTASNARSYITDEDIIYDANISDYSSIVDISNTVNYNGVTVHGVGVTSSGGTIYVAGDVDSRGHFYITSDDFSSIEYFSAFGVRLSSSALPPYGLYDIQFDFTSDFTCDEFERVHYTSAKNLSNAESITSSQDVDFYLEAYGDLFFEETIEVKNSSYLDVWVTFNEDDVMRNIGGYLSINFKSSSGSPSYSTSGTDPKYDSSESVKNTGIIAEAVQNLAQNIVSGMEPHYDNILTQLHHITEQLHAFWDQQYNLHHVPLMNKLEEIKTAISNMDVQVVVKLDGLKQAIDNMSLAIQNKLQNVQDAINNKLQSVQEAITNGFSTDKMDEITSELNDSIDDLNNREEVIAGFVSSLKMDEPFEIGFDSSHAGPLAFVASLMDGIFFSGELTYLFAFKGFAILAFLAFGMYRFRG